MDSLVGAKNVIIHLYNSTSELQRRVVFQQDQAGVKQIAVDGAEMVKSRLDRLKGADIHLQYSPESFTGTELDYALDVCEAVMDVWFPVTDNRIIMNLPSTVEMATPNIYADQRSEEHTSELQSLMRISYAVFCLK